MDCPAKKMVVVERWSVEEVRLYLEITVIWSTDKGEGVGRFLHFSSLSFVILVLLSGG